MVLPDAEHRALPTSEVRGPSATRAAAAVLGVTALACLSVQVVLAARYGPGSSAVRVVQLFAKFPVQAVALIAVASLAVARRDVHARRSSGLVHAALLGSLVTLAVYLLATPAGAPPPGPAAWSAPTALLAHYVLPGAALAGWLLLGPRRLLGPASLVAAVAWPAAWMLAVVAQAPLTAFSPYPFVDPMRAGWTPVLGDCALVLGLLALAAAALLGLDRARAASGHPDLG
ncbi:MAG: Pr6Pr family membrane protein [Kineosporiaceae bacterium]